MTVRHLKVFVCVCKHGNMTKAAEELFIAQPAVSNTIAEIEKNYNVKLFERINKRLFLTDEGKTLLIKAQEAVSAFDEFEEQALNSSKKPLLKIGSSLTIGKQKLPWLLRKLKENFTDIDFQISINQTAIIESKISNGTLDFAFIQGKPSDPNIKSRLVDCSTLIAVCGNKYNMPDTVTLKELCKYDLLLREDESVSREFLDHIFALENIVVTPVMESISNQALISAAVQNLGVTIMPEALLTRQLNNGGLRKIAVSDYEFTRNSYLIYHKDKSFGTVKKEIFDFCYKNYKNNKN
ncbi:MAG: LysR family transcriptional regulator [Ruminococcaceae bacterium]|nr:LysR family transcriptional regulator [Oscillospiraceae bacterium]